MTGALLAALFGVLQGLRHALEPDHVTAVAAMALRQKSARTTVMYAFAWGLGHAMVLGALGAVLVIFRAEMPVKLTLIFEVAVGVILVGLGLRALPARREPVMSVRRPLLVGIVHGLAGTGAVTAIAVAGAPGRLAAVAALTLYAAGAVIGMCLLAGAAGPIFARAASRPRLAHGVISASAATSIALGLVWSGKSIALLLAP